MRKWLVGVLAGVMFETALSGCTFNPGGLPLDDPSADAPPGQGGDAGDGCPDDVLPFEPTNFSRCDLPAAGPPVVLGNGVSGLLDTTTGELTVPSPGGTPVALAVFEQEQTDAPPLLVVVAEQLDIGDGAVLIVSGSRAVAIAAPGDADIRGEVQAGGAQAGAGPGAGHALCNATSGVTQNAGAQIAGSGGGGGGHAEPGGTGARVNQSTGGDTAAGDAFGEPKLTPLVAGCPGGDGGNNSVGAGGGVGGGGGGALHIAVGGRLRVDGSINVSGGGGGGAAATNAGGGGGGSGGALLLEAARLEVEGSLAANGGGGGEGTRGGAAGDPGDPGRPGTAQAAGGSGLSQGGDGGAGGARDGAAEPGNEGNSSGAAAAGGGGGGGATGRIRLRAVGGELDIDGGTISPAPITE